MKRKKLLYLIPLALVTLLALSHLIFIVTVGSQISALKNTNPRTTSLMRLRSAQYPSRYQPHLNLPLGSIPPDFISAVIYIEDFHFYQHAGFSVDSIKFALKLNKRLGYPAYGGSTITQQTARTLFLNPRKNYFRKYLEILTAVTMELLLSKNRILELYLNYAEWGKGVYGIAEASDYYFKKHPGDLTMEEKLALIAIMPSPLHFNPETFHESRILGLRYRALNQFARAVFKITPVFKSEIREMK